MWKQGQEARRKLATVTFARGGNLQAAVDQALKQKTDVPLHCGTSHRLFFFGADAAWEPADKPWTAQTQWRPDYVKIVECMMTQQGPADVLVFSDGRSRAVRAELDKFFDRLQHMWVVYRLSNRLGRKVAMASDTRETLCISLPSPRANWPVAARSRYNAVGEDTTHASTCTGVKPLAWAAAPRVFESEGGDNRPRRRPAVDQSLRRQRWPSKNFGTSVAQRGFGSPS